MAVAVVVDVEIAIELPFCALAAAGVVRVAPLAVAAATTAACGFEEDEIVETEAALPTEEKALLLPSGGG